MPWAESAWHGGDGLAAGPARVHISENLVPFAPKGVVCDLFTVRCLSLIESWKGEVLYYNLDLSLFRPEGLG